MTIRVRVVAGDLALVTPLDPQTVSVSMPTTEVITATVRTGLPGPQGPRGADGADGAEASSEALDAHIADSTPHPVYDDLPSLTLLFENGLV